MVSIGKKEAKKAAKGKTRAATSMPIPKSIMKKVEQESADEEVEESDEEEEDEENGGVSEKGMKRLMELVGEEDLDEYERARLALDDDEDEEDDSVEDDEDEEDEELDEEEVGELSGESDDDDEDEEDEDEDMEDSVPFDDSVLVDEADPDTIALDDLGSDVSVDEDAVPVRKVTANNKPAMRLLTETLKVTNYPFADHLVISSKETVDVDPSDDLKRETAFYKIALDQVANARKLCSKNDIPFTRPTDYYAEMVKSDDHMERIRSKLVEETSGIKKSEAARKQRELKKFGKQIQHEKLKQREMDKKGFADKIQGIKRKRQEGMELGDEGGDDEFGVAIDHGDDDRPARGSGAARGGRGGTKGKMPRSARDAKFSLGGGGRRSKQNTKESSNDFAGWSGDKKGGRGGKGGAGAAQRGRNRPGKNRRSGGRK